MIDNEPSLYEFFVNTGTEENPKYEVIGRVTIGEFSFPKQKQKKNVIQRLVYLIKRRGRV